MYVWCHSLFDYLSFFSFLLCRAFCVFFPLEQFVFNLCILTLNATVMKSRLIHLWKIRKAQLIHHFPLCVSVLSDNITGVNTHFHKRTSSALTLWFVFLIYLLHRESHRYTFRHRTINRGLQKTKKQLSLLWQLQDCSSMCEHREEGNPFVSLCVYKICNFPELATLTTPWAVR